MEYAVADESTQFVLGEANNAISLMFSDTALINFAQLMNSAVCAMLRARGIPIPEWIGQEAT